MMLGLAQAIVVLALAQAPAQIPVQMPAQTFEPSETAGADDFGQQALVDGRDAAAIIAIMENERIAHDDPARLINLGIAYARRGDATLARELFAAARDNRTRVELETAAGEWIDSRHLAREALAMLARGEFTPGSRIAVR